MRQSTLPIDDVLHDLGRALGKSNAVVLQAAPGAGKTTRVPTFLLDELDPPGFIVVLEPRRVAATASARRVAQERGGRLGDEVGVRIRHFKKESAKTRVLFVTEGILTRWLLADPFLESVSCVVLDEFHERNLHSDLCLGFLKELLDLRDDLKVVVMSATLKASRIASFLNDAPIIQSEGRAYPLSVEHIQQHRNTRLAESCVAAARQLMLSDDDDEGDVLVFLPGRGDIQRALNLCKQRPLPDGAEALPLYSALTDKEQARVLQKEGTRRRVVFSTNIAETSLTLEGVSAVVDSGYEKRMETDPARGLNALQLRRISKSSATQRAGRAGRTRPGRVVRLWGKAEHAQLHAEIQPELLRVDVTDVALWCMGFAARHPSELDLLDPMPSAHLDTAMQSLASLGACDENHRLTPLGKALLEMPLHPRIGICLLAAKGTRVERKMISLVSLLDEEDPLLRSSKNGATVECDLSHRIELEENQPHLVKRHVVERSRKVRTQLQSMLYKNRIPQSLFGDEWIAHVDESECPTGMVLLQGYSDRLCRRRSPQSSEAQMVSGQGVALHEQSGVRDAEFFIALQTLGRGRMPKVLLATQVMLGDLQSTFPKAFTKTDEAVFDEERGAVVGVRRARFMQLQLSEKIGVKVSNDDAKDVLLEAIRRFPKKALDLSESVLRTEARIRFAKLQHVLKASDGGEDAMLDEDWVLLVEDYLLGLRNFSQVKKLRLSDLLLQSLSYAEKQRLDSDVPERIQVPSGSFIRVDYRAAFGPERVPIFAVRLQEVFGLNQTPTVAGVPLLLHLLAPNQRPAALTSDLVSFWQGAYKDVRKELRQRYPKHSWPEDPQNAPPEKRPQRRKKI
ncbi:MAG: ATP-dependent helicase HrpB [Deltaproteobacteria bacterium]|nr:ATP-dependent helicase HrpB [Deltaproteobacteria bacterium]